jgi:hypothetical protein
MEEHVAFTAGLDTTAFEQSSASMVSSMKTTSTRITASMLATQKATDALSGSASKAQRQLHAMGNASAQIQDIAVGLQGGQKALTVFTQQVPQLLSAFGPKATILATVIAIGAGIYSWVSNAKEAEDHMKRLEASAKASAAAIEKIESLRNRDMQAAARASGKEEGIEERYQQTLEEIKQQERLIKFEDAAGNAKIAAAREAAALRRDEELAEMERKQLAEDHKKIEEGTRDIMREQAELSDKMATDKDNMMALAKSVGDKAAFLENPANGTPAQRDKMRLQMLKDQNELIDEGRRLQSDGLETQREAVTEAEKWRSEFEKTVVAAEKIEQKQASILSLQKQLDQARAIASLNGDAAAGQGIITAVANRAKTPQQRAAENAAERKQERDERKEIALDIQRRDTLKKKNTGQGLTQDEKRQIRAERQKEINAAKNKDKLMATIAPSDVQKLSDQIKDAIKELIELA